MDPPFLTVLQYGPPYYTSQFAKNYGQNTDNFRRISEESGCILSGQEANRGHCPVYRSRCTRVSDHPSSRYRAFILRLWQDDTNQGWRFSLEEIGRSLPRRGFSSLQAMTAFIETELDRSLPVQRGQPAADDEE